MPKASEKSIERKIGECMWNYIGRRTVATVEMNDHFCVGSTPTMLRHVAE